MKYTFIMLLLFSFMFHIQIGMSQERSRIESEYKLAVPDSLVDKLESFLQQYFAGDSLIIQDDHLSINQSAEVFVDQYYDTNDQKLRKQEIGLRHRLRYLETELLNELVQLKLSDSEDGIRRQEIKFDVSKKKNVLDGLSRHPVLQFLNPSDRDRLSFQLKKYDVNVNDVKEAVRLRQNRNRVYFSDKWGSVATITLDKVSQRNFPFHGFTELEIEINELRYTNASTDEILYLEQINENLKSIIHKTFPDLLIDQTPKYNKLTSQINDSVLSKVSEYFMWLIYVCIVGLALFKFVAF